MPPPFSPKLDSPDLTDTTPNTTPHLEPDILYLQIVVIETVTDPSKTLSHRGIQPGAGLVRPGPILMRLPVDAY